MRLTRAVIALVALALLAGSQGALGATQLSKTGKIGTWSVQDTDVKPGVECIYDDPGGAGNDIDLMTAERTPKVLARNRTGGRDSQWVGGRVRFERSVNPGGTGGFVTAKSRKLAKKLARDDKPVTWGPRSWLVDLEDDYHFRVTVLIRFYKPGSKTRVQGNVQILYQKYLQIKGASEILENDRCLPEY